MKSPEIVTVTATLKLEQVPDGGLFYHLGSTWMATDNINAERLNRQVVEIVTGITDWANLDEDVVAVSVLEFEIAVGSDEDYK